MELGHLLTRSGLTYPEVSSKVCRDSFCQSGSSVLWPWVIYREAFYLHVVSIFSCIPVICPKLVLFLTTLQFVYLFSNLSASCCSSHVFHLCSWTAFGAHSKSCGEPDFVWSPSGYPSLHPVATTPLSRMWVMQRSNEVNEIKPLLSPSSGPG